MSWHDATLYGLGLREDRCELALDIDYVIEWVAPGTHGDRMAFKIAPCTLIFEGFGELSIQLALGNATSIEVDQLERGDARVLPKGDVEWQWALRLHGGGAISLRSTGFRQTARREPVLAFEQSLPLEQRGGICLW